MPANARFAEASLRVDPDSLKKFFAGHGRYLTVFVFVSKPEQAGSVSPTRFVSASRLNQHASRVCSPEGSAGRAVTPYRCKLRRLAPGILSPFPALTRIPPGLLAL